MQAVTGTLVTSDELFAEFEGESSAAGKACTPLFPFNLAADQFGMKGPSCLGRSQDQQVRNGCSQLAVCGYLLRPEMSPVAGSPPCNHAAAG